MDKQDLRCAQYATAYDHEIIGVAADSDVSGKTDPFTRPDLGRWLTEPSLVASYDGIIASHLGRLGRSTRHWQRLLDGADEHGKTIICVEPQIDFSSPVGKLIGYIMSWLAEQELELITRRSKATQEYLRDNGYLVGRPPFGFMVIGKDDHKTLAPEPAEAGFIRQAAAKYLDGASLRAVCAWLDGAGAPPRQGGHWQPKSLSQVFRNPVLAGRRVDGSGRTVLKVEPILDAGTWRDLQAELDRKAARKGVVQGDTAMLTGIAVCARCGGPMYRIAGRYYRCHGTARKPSTCANMVPLADLESWVDEQLGDSGSFVIETVVIPGRGHADEIAEVERDLRELDYDDHGFLDRQAALLAERARLRALPSEPARIEEEVAPYTLGDLWRSLDASGKRSYLLDSGIKVAASRDERRIDGDPGRVAAYGWAGLVHVEDGFGE
jgi:DNA invertase Pin-like site-specific DNA recombinase